MDMPDSTLVMVMTKGIGANLTNGVINFAAERRPGSSSK
jgi:hypothetical protein